jgi:NAD(P)-dependent dehydrogenase (short-subunit alcohol dehydrogenase family)
MNLFSGKSVLVTGGAAGIGETAARRFAEEGASVCIVDRHYIQAVEVASSISAVGGKAIAFQADISIEGDNNAMVRAAIDAFGGLDIVFLNAGIFIPDTGLGTQSLAYFDQTLAVNLRGTYLGILSASRAMRINGNIIVTSSVAGLRGVSDAPAYSASKYALVGLVAALAPQLSDRGIRINAVCPGPVRTPMIGMMSDEGLVPASELPLVRFGEVLTAQHVAEMVLFLAGRAAGGVTGSALSVDGGIAGTLPPALENES